MRINTNADGARSVRDEERSRAEDGSRRLTKILEAVRTEHSLSGALEMVLAEACGITRAEAGTIYLREGSLLHVFVTQNEVLVRRLGAAAAKQRLVGQPVPLDRCSLAGYVA